jgi:hypothetical protein
MPFMPFLAAFLFALTGLVALAAHAQAPTVCAGTQVNINTPPTPAVACANAYQAADTTETPWSARLRPTWSPGDSTSLRLGDTTKIWPSPVLNVYSYTLPR